MAKPKVLILRAPGTNCDRETAYAFERAGGLTERVHVNRLLDDTGVIDQFQILCVPGGFSYGDDVAAGRILGNQIRHRLAERFEKFKADGKLILGICNGFQVLIKSGLLLPDDEHGPSATLTWNESGQFEDRWVNLATGPSSCVFFAGIENMYLPVAHAEGKFVTRSPAVLDDLERSGQIVLRYTTTQLAAAAEGAPLPFPANPNGSLGNVAGICDTTGRVCGLMPHPERHIDPTQHPRWTRGEAGAEGDGLLVFQNAVGYFQ